MANDHDSGYKFLFSTPELVRDLILGFVPDDWLHHLDYGTLERVPGSYVSEDLRQRADDLVWRVKVGGEWVYLYLLIEFQSTVDPYMALRMMVYVGLLYQTLIKEGQVRADDSSSHFKPTQGGCWRRLAYEDWETWAMKIEGNSACSKNNAGKQYVIVLTSNLIEKVRDAFRALPDGRKQSNARRYEMEDAALSAFAVFFSQSPSFLDSQVRMQKPLGRNNASSLFGVHEIPCDNPIRHLLDPVPPETGYPVMAEMGDALYQQGYLAGFRSINDTLLMALDGTDFFSSEKISWACYRETRLKNDRVLYRHLAVTPVQVAPGQANAIPLPPEFVQPQDGKDKQNCELAASARWLARWGEHYRPWRITYLGDDLYCHQSHGLRVRAQQADFLFTCQPESHATLYEWVGDFERNEPLGRVVQARRVGQKPLTDTYRDAHQVPLRNTDDAVMANWLERVTTDARGAIVFKNAWATSHAITDHHVAALASAGRARWKIENENNNTLKTKGDHFDHHFGHGKPFLANLFATLILLAFLVHTALDWMDTRYAKVRVLLPSRRTFFEHLRALRQYLPFDDWDHLMRFMQQRLAPNAPDTS